MSRGDRYMKFTLPTGEPLEPNPGEPSATFRDAAAVGQAIVDGIVAGIAERSGLRWWLRNRTWRVTFWLRSLLAAGDDDEEDA